MAPGADEGRSNLRKATGSRKQASIRGCPNGETRLSEAQSAYTESIGVRGEPPGGHGYGLRDTGAAVNEWPDRAEDWFREIGVIE